MAAHNTHKNLLSKQRHYFEKAQEMGRIGTWELDLVKNRLVWTKQNYVNFGVPEGTPMDYEGFLECVHPDDRAFVETAWQAAQKGKPYDIEHRVIANGEIKWVREKAELEFDSDNNCVRALGFTQDITDHKQTEESLKKAEAGMGVMLESVADAIFIVDQQGHYTYVNQQAVQLVGYSQDELLQMKITDLVPETDGASQVKHFEGILINDTMRREIELKHKDGSIVPVEIYSTLLPDGRVFGSCHNITVRRQAEEEKLQSEHIVSCSVDLMALLDREFTYLAVNPAYQKAFNLSREDFIGKTVTDILGEEVFKKSVRPHAERCMSAGETASYQDWFDLPRDGRQFFDVTYSPYTQKDKIEGFVVNVRNLTESRLSEMAMQESERRFRAVFEEAPLGVILVDSLTGHLCRVNSKFSAIVGRSIEELHAIDWMKITHPDDAQEDLDNMALLNAGEIPGFSMEKRYCRPDGSFVWARLTVAPISVADKNHPQHLRLVEDITTQKKTEELLRDSERKSLVWLEHSPSCTKMVDLDLNLQYMSGAGIKGLQIEDITEYYGKPYPFEFYPQQFKDQMTGNLERAIETGEDVAQEGYVTDVDGNVLCFHSTIVPVKNDNGQVDYLLVVSVDITEHKLAEAALQRQFQLNKTITDNAASCLFMINRDGCATFMNPAAEQVTGYTLDDIQDRPLHDVIHFKRADGSPYPMSECPIDNTQKETRSIMDHEDVFI